MIPKKIHFVYGLADNYGNMPFAFFHWVAIKSAMKLNPDFEIHYWYKHLPISPYFENLKDDLILHQLDSVPTHIFGNELCCVPHKADIVRLEVLLAHGGVYLDIDTITVKPFDDLLDNKCVMAREIIPDRVYGLSNAIIFAEPYSTFIAEWYNSYATFRSKGSFPNLPNDYYVEHSIWKPREISERIPEAEITILPMDRFCYPDWRPESLCKLFEEECVFENAYVHHLWESHSYNILAPVNENNYNGINCTYTNLLKKLLHKEISSMAEDIKNKSLVYYNNHRIELTTHGGNNDIYISKYLEQGKLWESHLTDAWYTHINDNDLVIDVGANIGWFTKIANLKNAVSIAIEPDPKNFNLLIQNCSPSNEFYNVCAGNNTNDVLLKLSNNNFGDNYVTTEGDITCKQNTIDNIVGNRANKVRAIKIDTQGYEPSIIQGAIETLKNVPDDCMLIIEYWPYALTNMGYSYDCYDELFEIFQGEPNFKPTLEMWEEYKNNPEKFTDIIIKKR